MKKPKKVYLYKIGRFQEDFEYVFPEIKVVKYITEESKFRYNLKECVRLASLRKKTKELIVICDRKNKETTSRFNKLGFIEKKHYMYLEDFADFLNYKLSKKEEKEHKIFNQVFEGECKKNPPTNSELFKRMMYTDPTYSLKCYSPFRYLQIQTEGSVYPCCGDMWATENIGNIYYNNPNKIWNSKRARIFRLSIINKTYAFCNLNNCPLELNKFEDNTPREKHICESEYPEEICVAFDKTCNLKCKSCRNSSVNENNNANKQKMYDKIIKKFFKNKWLTKADKLVMSSQGEVFFSNAYKKILFSNELKKRKSITIHTNGILLNQENIDKLCEQYEDISFYISLDSITDKIYENIRFGGKMKILKRNLELLSKAKQEGKIREVNILCVLQKSNFKELPEMAKFVIDLKFDTFDISKICNWGTYTDKEFNEISMYDDKGKPKAELAKILSDPIFKSDKIKFVGNVIVNKDLNAKKLVN